MREETGFILVFSYEHSAATFLLEMRKLQKSSLYVVFGMKKNTLHTRQDGLCIHMYTTHRSSSIAALALENSSRGS